MDSRIEQYHALDAARFARERLGFRPDARQSDLLRRAPRRVLLNCTRQWGKSTVTAARALHKAYFWPRSLTLVVTPGQRQSAEFMTKASAFLRELEIKKRGDGVNAVSILLPNESRIVGLPGNEATVRGFSRVSLLIVDEAARVDDDLFRAVQPMLAVGDGEQWVMSTPFGREGFFYEEWMHGSAEWERVSVTAAACPWIPRKHLDEVRARLGEAWYRQEYFCEFGDAEDALVSWEVLDRMWSAEWPDLGL